MSSRFSRLSLSLQPREVPTSLQPRELPTLPMLPMLPNALRLALVAALLLPSAACSSCGSPQGPLGPPPEYEMESFDATTPAASALSLNPHNAISPAISDAGAMPAPNAP